jgi:hypothetical protein
VPAFASLLLYLGMFALSMAGLFSIVAPATVVYGSTFGLAWGFVFWMFFGLPGRQGRLRDDIRMVETLKFSPTSARVGSARGVVGGFAAGALLDLILGIGDLSAAGDRAIEALLAGLVGAVLGAIIGGALGGLTRGYVRSRSRPNEGVWLSLRNMVLAGMTVTAAAVIPLTALLTLAVGGIWGASVGLTGAIFAGILAALWSGGMDVLRHVILRTVMGATTPLPAPLIPFLEKSVELSFLQRAGGGYLFIHNLMFSYFVEADPQRSNER